MSREWIEKIRLTRIENHRNGDTSWRNGVIAAAKAATGTKYSPERIEKAAAGQRGKPKSTNVLMGCRKPVVCVETGTWFASTAEASYRCGIGRTNITNALKTGGKSSGFRWAFGERKPLV